MVERMIWALKLLLVWVQAVVKLVLVLALHQNFFQVWVPALAKVQAVVVELVHRKVLLVWMPAPAKVKTVLAKLAH